MNVKDLGDFDFGFSAVSEEELKAVEAQQEVALAAAASAATEAQQKLEQLYKMIMPLLKNLIKDDGKDYIYWPDRQKKVGEFIKKVDALMQQK